MNNISRPGRPKDGDEREELVVIHVRVSRAMADAIDAFGKRLSGVVDGKRSVAVRRLIESGLVTAMKGKVE
jgi:hypothetical protein